MPASPKGQLFAVIIAILLFGILNLFVVLYIFFINR